MKRKHLLMAVSCIAAGFVFTSTASLGQSFGSKPMRIVTTEVGNNNDLLSRMLADGLTPLVGTQVIVENRAGAGGGMAIEKLISALPDGHTIMVHGTSVWLLPLLRDDTPWDPFKDFTPVSMISQNPAVMVVPASVPVKSVAELIDYAKARPGKLNYASVDDGSPSHLAAELFISMAGLKVERITYRGGAAAFNGMLSGEGQLMVNSIPPLVPHIQAGRFKALGVTAHSALLPNLPVIGASVPGYEWITHQAVFAPAKTPAAIIKRLNAEVVKVLASLEVHDRMMKLGTEVAGTSPQEVTAMMKDETTKMRVVLHNNRKFALNN